MSSIFAAFLKPTEDLKKIDLVLFNNSSLNKLGSCCDWVAPIEFTETTNTPELPANGSLTLFNKDLLKAAPTIFGSLPKPGTIE